MKRLGATFWLVCLLAGIAGGGRIAAGAPAAGEARAEAWGYDAADSTDALQAALDSGARRLVISRQAGP
ncbi:MAG: hypothetical protein GX608_03815, partial [Lentisphaerae bacterium]|nr:hypothetical protein [Lentisphaerota bacterium]